MRQHNISAPGKKGAQAALTVNLTAADVQDAAGAEPIVKAIRKHWPWLKHLFADGAYDRGKLMNTAVYRDFIIEVVRKLANYQGFQVQPRRWVVLLDDPLTPPDAQL